MQTVDLSTLSLQELKALAYDELAKQEAAQANLRVINQIIASKSQVTSTEEVEEPKEDNGGSGTTDGDDTGDSK